VIQRYLYLDASGKLQGPLWLSQMRDLYAVGRLSSRTEVCVQGDNQWAEIGRFPEITNSRMEAERDHLATKDDSQIAYERRMWRWLLILLGAYCVYVVRSWK
jgi:hypothetical protein